MIASTLCICCALFVMYRNFTVITWQIDHSFGFFLFALFTSSRLLQLSIILSCPNVDYAIIAYHSTSWIMNMHTFLWVCVVTMKRIEVFQSHIARSRASTVNGNWLASKAMEIYSQETPQSNRNGTNVELYTYLYGVHTWALNLSDWWTFMRNNKNYDHNFTERHLGYFVST